MPSFALFIAIVRLPHINKGAASLAYRVSVLPDYPPGIYAVVASVLPASGAVTSQEITEKEFGLGKKMGYWERSFPIKIN